MDTERWLADAVYSIQTKVSENQSFELKSLFDGCTWETLGKGERISLGRIFANQVREGKIPDVIMMERGKNNHLRYIKSKGGNK